MIKNYKYTVSGTAANDQTWTVKGNVECEFNKAFDSIMPRVFHALTNGEAVYGFPGVGCNGPYEVKSVWISNVKDDA